MHQITHQLRNPGFTHDWERQASLRLRAGDTSVIPEYEDQGRLHGGTREQMQDARSATTSPTLSTASSRC